MAMDAKQCYETLGLKPGATRFEVRQAYHDLQHVWQPDRVGKNLRLKKRAQDQLTLIKEAYETLEQILPKPEEAPAAAVPDLLDEDDSPISQKLVPSSAKSTLPPAPAPAFESVEYVPDGPPPPKVPLGARMREQRAVVGQSVAASVRVAIPFSRKRVILAILAVVTLPVAIFFVQQWIRGTAEPANVVAPAAPPRAIPAPAGQPPTNATLAAGDPSTNPASSQPAIAEGPPATIPAVAVTPDVTPVSTQPAIDPAAEQRASMLADLAKFNVKPPADASNDALADLLTRAKLAHDLLADGYKLDPTKVPLNVLNQYQAQAELAHQVEQLSGTKVQASDFTPAEMRDLKARALIVKQIADNGIKVSLYTYNTTELGDLLQRSVIIKELSTKYGIKVDKITDHPLIELEEMLRAAQTKH